MTEPPRTPYPFTPALRARIASNLGSFEPAVLDPSGLRSAAVGVVVHADAEGRGSIVLTRRPTTLRRHSGQWALPGGRLEPGESPAGAVLREIQEEIGLELTYASIIGRLDDYATRSGHLISPFVLWADTNQPLRVSPEEVEAAFAVPLADLDHPTALQLAPLLHFRMPSLPTTLHAPTAAIVYQFREVGLRGRYVAIAEVEQPYFAWR
jgi:mutator protein MutT